MQLRSFLGPIILLFSLSELAIAAPASTSESSLMDVNRRAREEIDPIDTKTFESSSETELIALANKKIDWMIPYIEFGISSGKPGLFTKQNHGNFPYVGPVDIFESLQRVPSNQATMEKTAEKAVKIFCAALDKEELRVVWDTQKQEQRKDSLVKMDEDVRKIMIAELKKQKKVKKIDQLDNYMEMKKGQLGLEINIGDLK